MTSITDEEGREKCEKKIGFKMPKRIWGALFVIRNTRKTICTNLRKIYLMIKIVKLGAPIFELEQNSSDKTAPTS